MKKQFSAILLWTIFAFLSLNIAHAQEEEGTGLPGDNFSLEGAVELFKQSESLEDFEKKLNDEKNYVNNLDLNEDGDIDYVRVIDNMEGDAHAIVLQVPVNEDEAQDVAVIEIEKTGEENAILQILGDEDLYGSEMIVEPVEYEEVQSKEDKGPNADAVVLTRIVVNVWLWPCVRHVYRPGYRIYVSPWRWGFYPRWWKPWRPHPWRVHFNHRRHYHSHCHVVKVHRVHTAHRVYTPRRKTSVTVKTRTVSRKTTTGKKAGVKTTTTTKVATNGNGKKAAVKKTETTKAATNGKGKKAGVKKTETTKAATNGKGKKAGVKKTETTKAATNGKGKKAGVKKTTTTKAKKGKNGKRGGVKKTTTKKGRKGGRRH